MERDAVASTLKKIKDLFFEAMDENISDYDLDDEIEVFLKEMYLDAWKDGYNAKDCKDENL